MDQLYTSLVTLLSVLQIFLFSWKASSTRVKHGIEAPQMHGHPDVDRAQRVHLNTMEQIIMFLPSLWLALPVLGDYYTSILGGVWLVGRQLYAHAYWADAAKRGTGMWVTFLAFIILFGAAAYGVAMQLI